MTTCKQSGIGGALTQSSGSRSVVPPRSTTGGTLRVALSQICVDIVRRHGRPLGVAEFARFLALRLMHVPRNRIDWITAVRNTIRSISVGNPELRLRMPTAHATNPQIGWVYLSSQADELWPPARQ